MMSLNNKIFVWNCRVASKKSFFRYCKNYVSMHKPTMHIVVETIFEPAKLYKTFQLFVYDNCIAKEKQGFADRIVVVWSKDSMSYEL